MKPLLIGEAPGKNEHPPRPLEGRVGRRLATCAGISFEEFLERFDRTNLLSVRQDTKEKGFEFDHVAAKAEAERLHREVLQPGQTVVLLGRRVAKAFDMPPDPFVEHLRWAWGQRGFIKMYVVPHPSGINRWFNEPTNVSQMNEFMRRIARGLA